MNTRAISVDPFPLPKGHGILQSSIGLDGRGWVLTENLQRDQMTAFLKTRFGSGFWFRDMYFSQRGARILVIDRTTASDLPPGFAVVPDLDDTTESHLVNSAKHRLDRIEAELTEAAGDAQTLDRAKRELDHILVGLFWRDPHVPPGPRPSGPWAAVSAQLTQSLRDTEELAKVIRSCLDQTRALIRDQHGGIGDVGILAPVWYTERQAQGFDKHRDFPRLAGTKLKQVIDRMNRRSLLEIGAGTGRVALALQKAGLQIPMHLTDNAPIMLDYLRERFRGSQVKISSGRMDDLPALVQGADTLIEHEVFFLHPNPHRLASKLAQFLKHQGVLIRLERQSTKDSNLTLLCNRFDRQIVVEMASPVGFVGEGTFATLDNALAQHGFETLCLPAARYLRDITRDEVLTARSARAFPYLEMVSDVALDRALLAARATEGPARFTIQERYDIRVTATRDLLARLTGPQA